MATRLLVVFHFPRSNPQRSHHLIANSETIHVIPTCSKLTRHILLTQSIAAPGTLVTCSILLWLKRIESQWRLAFLTKVTWVPRMPVNCWKASKYLSVTPCRVATSSDYFLDIFYRGVIRCTLVTSIFAIIYSESNIYL